MTQFKILVTAAGGALAPLNIQLMKCGSRHDIWVAAVDNREDASGRYFADYFEVVPNGNELGYAEAIADLVRNQGVNLVLPWSDEEALALTNARGMIEDEGAILACTSTETLALMNDKAASYIALENAGVTLPSWRMVETEDALREVTHSFHLTHGEFAVKPTVARGNRGTFVIRQDVDDVRPYLGSREVHLSYDQFVSSYLSEAAESAPVMVMERLFAPAYDIDVLAQDGKLLRAMPRERLNPAGVPFTGGILRPRQELLELAERVTTALRINWLYDYDIMTTRDGSPVILELNPRPSGSIAAAILAGIPFYDDLVSLEKGDPLPEIATVSETAVIPYTNCIIVPTQDLP